MALVPKPKNSFSLYVSGIPRAWLEFKYFKRDCHAGPGWLWQTKLWVMHELGREGSLRASSGQCSLPGWFCVGAGNSGKKVPLGCVWVELNTGTLSAVPIALTLKLHDSVFSHMTLAPFNHCPFAGTQGECLQARVCALSLSEDTWVSRSLLSHLGGRDPCYFHCQLLCGLLFLALMLQLGKPGVVLRPLAPQGPLCCWDTPHLPTATCAWKVSLSLLPVSMGLLLVSLSLLPVSMAFLLYILHYRTSVQLVFIWFSRLIIL